MTQHYVCIHGHFYQPPRENAWLEAIESQDSAHPYHDWNERITAECYAANAASRILDPEGYIVDIVNNYARMSFNFGPTLFSWLEHHSRDVYRAILDADKIAANRFGNHGTAIAQAYNHMIMPLANRRDKETQVLWGIRDFEHRFGRHPEGMWLPETAVDMETLEILADNGILFTLLGPAQAEAVRPLSGGRWQDVSDGSIDTTRAYRQELPSGRSLALFFYHGELSHAVAFEQLPVDGNRFFDRIASGFKTDTDAPQLLHICSDGETYGHHQHYGDMGLAYVLQRIDESDQVDLTDYGAYLAAHPPEDEVRIKANTSWSCPHGVGRWQRDCGCSSGGKSQWHQRWRQPLREAMDGLRDALAPVYEAAAGRLLEDPWQARNDYIEVVLQRDSRTVERFLRRHSKGALSSADQVSALKALEMQRNAMLMYTSCGWFFDDISGIEAVQIIQYAARVLQLAGLMTEHDLEGPFLEKLAQAESNLTEYGNGKRIYESWVRPAMVNLAEVGAHFAISALFREYAEVANLYCYQARQRAHHYQEAGRSKLALGRVEITSMITWETVEFYYGVLHFGDHNIACGLLDTGSMSAFQGIQKQIVESYEQADFPAVVQKLNQHFSEPLYSMKSLFRDDQRAILEPIIDARVTDAISIYRAVYEPNVPLLRFLKDTRSLRPRALTVAGELVLNHELQDAFSKERLDHEQIGELLEQARLAQIHLEEDSLEYTLRMNIEHMAAHLEEEPNRFEVLDNLAAAVDLVYALPFHVVLRKAQNTHFKIGRQLRQNYAQRALRGIGESVRWLERFDQLAEKLLIRVSSEGGVP